MASTSSPSSCWPLSLISACGRLNTEKKSPSGRSDEGQCDFYMSYFVYILECADKSLYVGCTNNLERRLKQHNDSKWGAHYTKIRRPVELKYKQIFKTLKEARQRETELKGWRREKKLELINNS